MRYGSTSIYRDGGRGLGCRGREHLLAEDLAHAEPPLVPARAATDQVDERFLDALTKVNNLQIPDTLSSYQGQIDSLASPRALAQSALRLVSAYVNPRGQNYHDSALLGPLHDPAERARRPAEPERSLRHRQPGQPAGHLVRDQ